MATFGITSTTLFGVVSIDAKIAFAIGSSYTCPSNGVGDSISAYIRPYRIANTKAALYNNDRSGPIGTTSEIATNNGGAYYWITWPFTAKPTLIAGTQYIIAVWGEDTGDTQLTDNSPVAGNNLHFDSEAYGGAWPNPLTINYTAGSFVWLTYCTYTPSGGGNMGLKQLGMGYGGAGGRTPHLDVGLHLRDRVR
jgi:hypothetical protein